MIWALISFAGIALGFAASTVALALHHGSLKEHLAEEAAEVDRLVKSLEESEKKLQAAHAEIKLEAAREAELIANHQADIKHLRTLLDKCSTPEMLREELNRLVNHA